MSEVPSRTIALPHVEATDALGRRIGARLQAGQGVALVGDLGAGKTSLTRGIGFGLGLGDPAAVCSPTYLLVIEHPGPVPLVHIDAYLPAKTRGFLEDGGLDYLDELKGVVVVEWADRLEDLLPLETLWITMRPLDGGREARLENRMGAFGWIGEV